MSEPGANKRVLASDALVSPEWFRRPRVPHRGPTRRWIILGLGAAFGVWLLAAGHPILGSVLLALNATLGVVGLFSPATLRTIEHGMGRFGDAAATVVGALVLTPVLWLVLPVIRLMMALSGRDPLARKADADGGGWIRSDSEERKIALFDAMFCSEPRLHRGISWAAVAVGALLLVGAAEGLLRLYGFGRPILYTQDPVVGYYPAPNQSVRRGGSTVRINALGMRGPEVSLEKPAGTFRILLLGDSTLYGGSYLDDTQTYARLLEASLNDGLRSGASGGTRVEVLAAAANGWGPFHKLGYIEKFGTLGADLALVCLPGVDIEREFYGLEKLGFMPAARPPRLALEEVAYHLTWRYRATVLMETPTSADLSRIRKRGVTAYVDLAKRLRTTGCIVGFEVLPGFASVQAGQATGAESERWELLRAAASREAIPAEFGLAAFAGHAMEKSLYHDPVHLGGAGHRRYAEYLKRRVRELHPGLIDR